MAKLAYTVKGSPIEFNLDPGQTEYTIGRNPRCDIRINNPSISRKHAEIRYDTRTQTFTIFDLNSSNGTFVNGKRSRSQMLSHNDEFLCGEFKFLFIQPTHSTKNGTELFGTPPKLENTSEEKWPLDTNLNHSDEIISEKNAHAVTHFPGANFSLGEQSQLEPVFSSDEPEKQQLKAEIETLASEIERLQRINAGVSTFRAENENLKIKRDKFETQIRELMRQLDYAETRVIELESTNEQLEQALQDQVEKAVVRRRESLISENSDVKQQSVERFRQKLNITNQKNENLQLTLAAQEDELKQTVKRANELRAAFKDLSEELRVLVALNNELRAELREKS